MYLEELDIINFVKRDSVSVNRQNLNTTPVMLAAEAGSSTIEEFDLLIISENIADPKLADLFGKIIQSLDKINNNLSKEIIYTDNIGNIANKIYKKFLIFGKLPDKYYQQLSSCYNLNNNNVLIAESIENIANNLEFKKKLWHNLQNFLAR